MREANTMRLSWIIERRFFPNDTVLTFASAPRTHNLHGDLTFLLSLESSKNHAANDTCRQSRLLQGNLTVQSKDRAFCCIQIDKEVDPGNIFWSLRNRYPMSQPAVS